MPRTSPKSTNIQWQPGFVNRDDRARLNGHRGVTLWLTGLSGSGKSTLARQLELALVQRGVRAFVLDGDNIRHGLNSDLGFSPAERQENIRRVGEVAKLFVDAGVICITAFISPYASDRQQVRALHGAGDFVELHVNCPLARCEARDPKGLYARARRGEIKQFTGVSAPYEAPASPELEIHTDKEDVARSTERVIEYLEDRGYLSPRPAAK
ncbi:MAG: adenylyl-sulfate kinase [Myxococcales bacterium]|nr:adenylyl-sulfate kinase [Myxococcales bacterium]